MVELKCPNVKGVSKKVFIFGLNRAVSCMPPNSLDVVALKQELCPMKNEMKHTTEERDILKRSAAYFAKLSD